MLGPRIRGASFPFLAANIVDPSGKPFLPPYLVKTMNGVQVGIIGLTHKNSLKEAPGPTAPYDGLDEATTVNKYTAELKAKGVHTDGRFTQLRRASDLRSQPLIDKPVGMIAGDLTEGTDRVEKVRDIEAFELPAHQHPTQGACTRADHPAQQLPTPGFRNITRTRRQLRSGNRCRRIDDSRRLHPRRTGA